MSIVKGYTGLQGIMGQIDGDFEDHISKQQNMATMIHLEREKQCIGSEEILGTFDTGSRESRNTC